MPVVPVTDDVTEVAYWRGRAERAEARLVETEERISQLSEQVAVLSRMLFGRSSEKTRPVPDPDGEASDGPRVGDPAGRGSQPGRRGQRPGSRGHGRRDYSHLDTREEIHDVSGAERVCSGCGAVFEPLGSEDSEQIDWQVTVTRLVHRRRRYRRRCGCPGPRTVTAPVPAKPVRKGRFTAGFLARLL